MRTPLVQCEFSGKTYAVLQLQAFQLTNLTSQEELVNLALQELVYSRRKKNLLDLAGRIQFTEDFDHKVLRETRYAAD